MGAPIKYFIDPAIAADTGAGTLADPWGDIQFALNTATRNATHGDRMGVIGGTAELQTVALSLVTYGTPTFSAPLIFQGITAAGDDGDLETGTGIGAINMQGNNASIIAAGGGIFFRHMKLFNTGTAAVLNITTDQIVMQCEITQSTGGGIISDNSERSTIVGNHVHDIGALGISRGGHVLFNYLKNDGTNDFTAAINAGANTANNIISIDGSSDGIRTTNIIAGSIANNSILSGGGTGKGILTGTDELIVGIIMNNLVEGFSGAGGVGITINSTSRNNAIYAGNAAFNNTTNYSDGQKTEYLLVSDNETLSASPYDKTGPDTFANRDLYFSSVDTGNVHGGAFTG